MWYTCGIHVASSLHTPSLQVMHLADFWPGPVWLYAAPGSGVWWTAGRHVVARNLVAALLHFKPLSEVVAHLSLVRNGDRRCGLVGVCEVHARCMRGGTKEG